MGRDKGLLPHFEGGTWAERALQILSRVTGESAWLSIHGDQGEAYRKAGLEANWILDEEGERRGPISGLLAAHRNNPEMDWLVLACDLVFLSEDFLQEILQEAHRTGKTIIGTSSRGVEPTCGLYTAEFLAGAREASRKYGDSLQGLFRTSGVAFLTGPDELFRNINYPREIPEEMPERIKSGGMEI